MSPELKRNFERVWPVVEPRVRALLAHKGVPASRRDDIVQETGLRLFTMWEKVDQSQPPAALAVTIALNLLRDEARKHKRSQVIAALPEVVASDDVESAGIALAELHRVKEALTRLSPSRREVLLAEVGSAGEHLPLRGAAAVKMLRMRARRELQAILEKAQGIALIFEWRARQTLGSTHQLLARLGLDHSGTSQAVAGSLVAVALLTSPSALLGPPRGALTTDASTARSVSELAIADNDAVAGTTQKGIYETDRGEQIMFGDRRASRHKVRASSRPAQNESATPTAPSPVSGDARVEGFGTSHVLGVDGDGPSYSSAGSPDGCSASCAGDPSSVTVEVCLQTIAGGTCLDSTEDPTRPN